jgi:hypothetical protein
VSAALVAAVEPVEQVSDKLAEVPAFVGTMELVSADTAILVAAAAGEQKLVELAAGSSKELAVVAKKHQRSSMKLMMKISKSFRSSMRSWWCIRFRVVCRFLR